VEGTAALRSPSALSLMSSSSSRATSRIQSPARMEMPIFVYPRCRAGVDRRVSRTPQNHNRPFYMCSENGVRIGAIAPFSWSGSLSNLVDLFGVHAGEMLLPLGRCSGQDSDE
jgi:hypothetical protein